MCIRDRLMTMQAMLIPAMVYRGIAGTPASTTKVAADRPYKELTKAPTKPGLSSAPITTLKLTMTMPTKAR